MDWTVILPEFLKQGAGYVIAAIFIWISYMLYKENRVLNKELRDEQKANTTQAWTALGAAKDAGQAQTDAMKQLKEIVETAILRGGRAK